MPLTFKMLVKEVQPIGNNLYVYAETSDGNIRANWAIVPSGMEVEVGQEVDISVRVDLGDALVCEVISVCEGRSE